MSSRIVGTYQCHVCGRPVTRLAGVGSIVDLAGGGGARALSEVLGYCGSHPRTQVVQQWRAELEQLGAVQWVTSEDAVADLRPAHVAGFLARTDAMFQQTLPQGQMAGSGRGCPHCGGPVAWGSGPHVGDSQQREGAEAWECQSCGAAGLAYLT